MSKVNNFHQICFWDDNPIKAVTPTLDNELGIRKVTFFCDKKPQQTDVVIKTLTEKEIKVDFVLVNTGEDPQELQQLLLANIAADESYLFNASTGLPQQIVIASLIFAKLDLPIFVIDQQDHIRWLTNPQSVTKSLDDNICLNNFFALYGAKLTAQLNFKMLYKRVLHNTFLSWLAESDKLSRYFGQLNGVTSNASPQQQTPSLTQLLNKPNFRRLIKDMTRAGMGHLSHDDTFIYHSHSARMLAQGGWLEFITTALIDQLSYRHKEIQDIAWGAQVSRQNQELVNEFDTAILCDNKLYIIECKTKNYVAGETKSIIYQLGALADIVGGYSAKGALVTLKDISDNDLVRAKELGIAVFGPRQLPKLKQHLANWLLNTKSR